MQFHSMIFIFVTSMTYIMFMQPVIRHSFVRFPRNAKPKVSASFQECGDSGTWTMEECMDDLNDLQSLDSRADLSSKFRTTNFEFGLRREKLRKNIFYWQDK